MRQAAPLADWFDCRRADRLLFASIPDRAYSVPGVLWVEVECSVL